MKKRKWLSIVLPVLIVAAVAGGIGLMILSGSGKEKLTDRYCTASELSGKISPNAEIPVMSHNGMSLYLEENMAVRIEDGKGNVWSTNGKSYDGKITTGQFGLSYYTANAAYSTMESQADSVDKNQAQAFLQDETLYVQYKVGDYEKTADFVPNYMKDARFREKFLNLLSEEEAAQMEEFYKYYKEDDAWRIRSKGRNNFKVILGYMEKVGYTDEDLLQDNADGGITTDIKEKPWFTVVLAYRLTEDGLSVSIPVERIEYSAAFPLYEIDLLPNFGLMEHNEEGYVLLPDGSGALMRFATDYNSRTEYSIPIYGQDRSVASDMLSTGQFSYEFASLPVFGVKDGSASYLAVVDGCAGKASVSYHQAGTYFQRNGAYLTFRMVNKDSVYLSGSDNSSKVIVFEAGLAEITPSVEYHFLENGSDYTDMAAYYRNVLQQSGQLTDLPKNATASLLLETICGVYSKKNALGISYEGITAATTYEQNKLLAQDLQQAGVQALDMKLIGWFNGGVYHDYAGNIRLNRQLGGKSAWMDLVNYAEDAGVGLYPDVDFQRIPDSARGFMPMTDSAFRLDGNEAKFSILSRALLLEKEDVGMTPSNLYLLAPGNFMESTEGFLEDFSKIRTPGLSLRSTDIYSDFNKKDMISRPESELIVQAQLERIAQEQDLMIRCGGAYTFAYTQVMSGVASDSSHFRLANETVPFLQMVLHGSMKLYTSPINLASNSQTAVLRAIEYGMLPCFQVTYDQSSVLKNSEYTDNFASGYENWREDILKAYAMANDGLEGLIGCGIIDHRQVAQQVFATTYENGDVVYVNYSTADVTVDGHTVPARGIYRERSGH